MKLSVREEMVPGSNLTEKFRNLKKLGFDGIEIGPSSRHESIDEIKQATEETGVQPSITTPIGGGALFCPGPPGRGPGAEAEPRTARCVDSSDGVSFGVRAAIAQNDTHGHLIERQVLADLALGIAQHLQHGIVHVDDVALCIGDHDVGIGAVGSLANAGVEDRQILGFELLGAVCH